MVFDPLNFAIILFTLGGVGFAVSTLLVPTLIAPRAKGGDLGMPYECGMRPHGPAWTTFGMSFYMYALLFIAFDVDVLYLFPVALQYSLTEGWAPFFKILVFLSFLLLALIYFCTKKVFTWQRKIDI